MKRSQVVVLMSCGGRRRPSRTRDAAADDEVQHERLEVGPQRRRVQGGLGRGGGAAEASERHSSHPWRVLRSEVLPLIASLYSHLTRGVIDP